MTLRICSQGLRHNILTELQKYLIISQTLYNLLFTLINVYNSTEVITKNILKNCTITSITSNITLKITYIK